jgi:hypothetical protein
VHELEDQFLECEAFGLCLTFKFYFNVHGCSKTC